MLQLRNLNINKDQFDKLAQILRLGDFVKFAKYQPAEADDAASLDIIKQAIVTIEQSETISSSNEGSQKEAKR